MLKMVMLTLAGVALLLSMSVSDVLAQGRGRGRGHNNWKWGDKCDKFVNCHDARDGRWDNRGPRRRVTVRNRVYRPYPRIRVREGNRPRRVYDDRVFVRNRPRR